MITTTTPTVPHPTGTQTGRPRLAWLPPVAVVWALAYGALRSYWALGHTPSFPPLGADLMLGLAGWPIVGLCLLAAGLAILLPRAPWSPGLAGIGVLVGLGFVAACPLLLLDVIGMILPGLGLPHDLGALASRLGCLAIGVQLLLIVRGYRRRWRADCLSCGRRGEPRRLAGTPRWAWVAGYVAVAGAALRVAAQVGVGFDMIPLHGGASVVLFEVGFVLAGTLLPLALVHRWGRIWPAWVLPLAGRRVPRWVVLGPALGIAGGLVVYFGVGAGQLIAGLFTGATTDTGPMSLPPLFFWVAVPAYLLWGIGLAVAAVGYLRCTRPVCADCGR